MNGVLQRLEQRLNKLEKENAQIKLENEQIKIEMQTMKIRINKMYEGWGRTKSDLAKLKIQLVQRNDLQKILKDRKRSDTVVRHYPELKPYFKTKHGRKSALGIRKEHLHKTVGHDLIKQPGERNRIMKWITNAEKKTQSPSDRLNYIQSPATSIGSLKKNDVFMKTFEPIRKTREQHSNSWKSNTARSNSTKSRTPTSSQQSVSSKRR